MNELQFQMPEWMSAMNKRDRNKVLKQCERTILCIPNDGRKPLTEKEVMAALGVRRAVVLADEKTDGYWVRSSDEEYQLFREHLSERGLPGHTTREVDWEGGDWERLAQKLVDDMRFQTGGGPSQSQKSIEQRAEASSTSLLVQVAKNDDTEIGKSLDSPVDTTTDASGFSSVRTPSSPRETSPRMESSHDDARTPTEEVPDKRHPKKARHKQNEAVKANTASSINKSTSQQSIPYLDIAFAKFSPELVSYIFKLCLEDVTSSEEHNRILEKLVLHEGRCLEVLEEIASLWTRITSSSPDNHVKRALDLSKLRPLHIEGGPDHSAEVEASAKQINKFIGRIRPHRARWASLQLLFPSSMLKRVKKHLGDPAPCLEDLSLSMADAALETGLALPVDDTLRREIGTPLDILGGEAGKLQRVTLNNIPCLWNPAPFVNVVDIALTNGIHLRYADLILFFRHSTLLRSLRLINIKIVGEVPQVVEQVIPLPNLAELVLVELVEPIGLGGLYLSLDAPKCEFLHLDLRPSMAFLRHPALEERAASTVQKALASSSTSYLLFRSNANTQSASWQSEEEMGRKGSDEHPAFNICLRSTDTRLASLFCAFVRGVQTYVGDLGAIVVDVGDSVSGAIVEPFGLELDEIVPTLFPESFQGLNVVEVRADVVDGYLQHLKEMMALEGSAVWCFGSLQTLRLRAIPEGELEDMPDESARCSLELLVSHIYEKRYGAANVPPGEGLGLSLALHGLFTIETQTGLHLGTEDTLHGIEINHSAAVLVYDE